MSKSDRDALKAAAYTALWVFLAMFGMTALGWLADVSSWATSQDATVVFPDPRLLVKGVIAAVVAAASFVVAAVVRLAQAHNILPGQPPSYLPPPAE